MKSTPAMSQSEKYTFKLIREKMHADDRASLNLGNFCFRKFTETEFNPVYYTVDETVEITEKPIVGSPK